MNSGVRTAATAGTNGPAPAATPIPTTPRWSTAHTAARVRRRRVQARGPGRRPRSESPRGPTARARAVATAATGTAAATAAPATATAPTRRLSGRQATHHLQAKRVTDPDK